ncbi:MAG: hypothetical protein ACI89L_001494 [Phycisphaerales bacterium]|jgi:hypothetical protein
MRTAIAALTGLIALSSPAFTQPESGEASEVIADFEAHYEALGGFLVTITESIDAPNAPIAIPSEGKAFGALVVRPNRVKLWQSPDSRSGMMSLQGAIDTTGDSMILSFGAPLNLYQESEVPESFEALLDTPFESDSDNDRNPLGFIPGLTETLSLFTGDGFAVEGLSLSDLEYVGIQGEDTELTHVFEGVTTPEGDDGQGKEIAVHINAVGTPWLTKIVATTEMRVVMGGEGETKFDATMTTAFTGWNGIPSIDLTKGREQVTDINAAMKKKMQGMHQGGEN